MTDTTESTTENITEEQAQPQGILSNLIFRKKKRHPVGQNI
jgi:hypothetical protein